MNREAGSKVLEDGDLVNFRVLSSLFTADYLSTIGIDNIDYSSYRLFKTCLLVLITFCLLIDILYVYLNFTLVNLANDFYIFEISTLCYEFCKKLATFIMLKIHSCELEAFDFIEKACFSQHSEDFCCHFACKKVTFQVKPFKVTFLLICLHL